MGKKLVDKVNKNIFLAAVLVLIIFFLIGYFGILLYDDYKKSNLEYDFALLNQQILLDDLYTNYLEDISNSPERCEVLNNQLMAQIKVNDQLFERLRLVNRNAIVESDNKLKYMYVLTNVKLWMHYNKINRECDSDVRTLLYFYPEVHGDIPQKAQIDSKTRIFEYKLSKITDDCNYLSFALPYIDYMPILDQIIKDNNITDAPVAIINDNLYYDIPNNYNEDPKFFEEIGCIVK